MSCGLGTPGMPLWKPLRMLPSVTSMRTSGLSSKQQAWPKKSRWQPSSTKPWTRTSWAEPGVGGNPGCRCRCWNPESSHHCWNRGCRHHWQIPGCRHRCWNPGYRHRCWNPGCRHCCWNPGYRHSSRNPGCRHSSWNPGCRHSSWNPGCRHCCCVCGHPLLFFSLRNPLIQCMQSVPPYQGTVSAVARAMLPIPTDVCSISCIQTVIWLQLFRILDVHEEVDECDCTQGLYEHCIRVCTESWNSLLHQGTEPALILGLAFRSSDLAPARLSSVCR